MRSRVLKVGTYNVEFGHPKAKHAQMIWKRFTDLDLDVLCVCEAKDYVQQLRKLAKENQGRVLVKYGKVGSDQQIILVKEKARVSHVWSITAGLPYRMATGGTMPPEQPLCAIVDGVVVVVRHAPVQAWVADPHDHGIRKWTGPAARLLAYRHSQVRVARVFKNHPYLPVLCFGDWNATPGTKGQWSPEWLREQVGGIYCRPHRNTGHGEIDFGIVRGAKVLSCKVEDDVPGLPHSDHRLVVAQLSVPASV